MAAFESIPADIPDDNEALDDHDIFDSKLEASHETMTLVYAEQVQIFHIA